jgi:hypothetical protein
MFLDKLRNCLARITGNEMSLIDVPQKSIAVVLGNQCFQFVFGIRGEFALAG